MSIITRETVMTALFDLISTSYAFTTVSRKLKLWTDVPMEQRPYMAMAERLEENTGNDRGLAGVPVVRTWHVDFYVYTDAHSAEVPASLLNPILDAVELAMRPSAVTGRQTLGGLVAHAWIVGQTFKDPGDIDGDGMLVIPVSILVP